MLAIRCHARFRCLDGSPGAYYIRTANAAGVAADPTKWVLFMEGGGWASSISESVSRTHTALGSSKGYGPQPVFLTSTAQS